MGFLYKFSATNDGEMEEVISAAKPVTVLAVSIASAT